MIGNLFHDIPAAGALEQFTALVEGRHVRIERIVSHGQVTPPGEWYDQPLAEWVVVLAGAARLRFEDEPAARALAAGDWIDIAPGRRHRVEWTDPAVPTVWLAVHYGVGPDDTQHRSEEKK